MLLTISPLGLNAVRKAGAKGLEVYATLTITYVGDDEPKRKGMSGAKRRAAIRELAAHLPAHTERSSA